MLAQATCASDFGEFVAVAAGASVHVVGWVNNGKSDEEWRLRVPRFENTGVGRDARRP